jgi:hypothetical protein
MIAPSIALAAMSGAVQAGITVKSVDGSGETSVISIDGNRLRIDGDEQVLVYDGDNKELMTADPRNHTYSTANENDLKQMGAELKKRMDPGAMRATNGRSDCSKPLAFLRW